MKWICGIVTLLVILGWYFVPYSDGRQTTKPIDYSTIRTKSTLEADAIVIGEVVKISNTFTDPNYRSMVYSFVTVQVDTILKSEKGKKNEKCKTITFLAPGGPDSDGTFTEIVGEPTFKKVGERVFLSLKKVTSAKMLQWYKELSIPRFGGKCIIEKDKVTQEYVVKQGWAWIDVSVSDMKKIIPVILKHPDEMKELERETVALRQAKMPLDGMLAFVRARVADLEALDAQQQQEQK